MLNTNIGINGGNTTNNMNISAVSGTMVRNHPNSFFKRFHMKSDYADWVFNDNPYIEKRLNAYEMKRVPVIVLQTMLCGEGQFLAEIVKKDDYFKGECGNE